MSVFYVKANIYNFESWRTEFEIKDVKFYVETFLKVRDKFRKEINPQITGYVELNIENMDNCDKAIEIAQKKLELYSKAMSFAQGHDVFFNDFSCYEFTNGIKTIKQEISYIVRIGKSFGSGIVATPHITAFLEKSIPKLLDDEFLEATGIDRALDWYNISKSLKVVDNIFIALFMGLEILANSWANYSHKEYILTSDELIGLEKEFHDLVKYKLQIEPSCRRSALYSNLKGLNRVSIANKIFKLLECHGIPSYSNNIREIVRLRDSIIHGEKIDYNTLNVFNLNNILEKILEKIILAELEIGEEVLHGNIFKILENGV